MEPEQLENLKAGLSLHTDTAKAGHVALAEEYKALWAYYIRTLDERARIFDVYFKIISMPFVFSGAVILYLRSIDLQSKDPLIAQKLGELIETVVTGLSVFFALSSLAGLLAYLYYSLESANSRIYLRALSAIRADWRERYQFDDALVIDLLRPKSRYLGDWIVHSRGAVFAMFNSSMIFVAAWFYYGNSFLVEVVSRPIMSLSAFVGGVLLHAAIGILAMKVYARSPGSRKIDEAIDSRLRTHADRAIERSAVRKS